ncbi:hypothetical protein Hypma_002863 [Hypsizygus marmoreus]|uniref:Cyclin-like f-box protein n=1 Tax=Hypsizygus marmoreus TaxID=39966 RepID=A0A369J3Q4_HYPMA|nr:hypothetical protein Hypma_002863 [Hypsizygus marmoreus]
MFSFTRILQLTVLLTFLFSTSSALPLAPRQRKSLKAAQTGASRLPAVGSGAATATDGSTIIDRTVVVNGLKMRFKVSAPASELVGATAGGTGGATGTLGINVLFHGDGGQSFFDFPNQGANNGLMGVALLSPDPQLRWGGFDPADRTGLVRPDGATHSAAVNQLLTTELPKFVNFDPAKVFLEGISGGSLLLSGFLLPQFGASLGVPGAVLGCGGLEPQVAIQGDLSNLRLHWQSTIDELPDLQTSIPQAIAAYEKIAVDAGLSNAQITQLQTADASPNGGHCEFDERDFVSGVQLLTNNYAAILSGNGALNGVTVTNGVVGNEQVFAGAVTGAGTATRTGTANRNKAFASALRAGRTN